jgi:hypothetical protein
MTRMLQGDFAKADKKRGRFRDLLKTATRNMVRNYWEKQKVRAGVALDPAELPEEDRDQGWDVACRQNLLDLAWAALEEHERTHPGSLAYRILRLRTEYSDESSDKLATRFSAILGQPMRADTFRQQLRRARVRFAEFLVREIADGLDSPDSNRIREDLIDLELYESVKDLLPGETFE